MDTTAATRKTIVLVTHGAEEAVFLTIHLVLPSPRPARIVERRSLDFGRRFAAGTPARALESLPEFVAAREAVLAAVFALEPHLQ